MLLLYKKLTREKWQSGQQLKSTSQLGLRPWSLGGLGPVCLSLWGVWRSKWLTSLMCMTNNTKGMHLLFICYFFHPNLVWLVFPLDLRHLAPEGLLQKKKKKIGKRKQERGVRQRGRAGHHKKVGLNLYANTWICTTIHSPRTHAHLNLLCYFQSPL